MNLEAISEERNKLTNQKVETEEKLTELLTNQLEVNLPPALKEEKKLNIIFIGPESSGRTTAATYLAQEHQRCLIKLDQLVDYWAKRGNVMADEATTYLQEKEAELKIALEEQEKRKKQKKKPKAGEEEKDVVPEEYKYLPESLLIKMLTKRL